MKTNGDRNGFSMIEVLVASAILVIIVLMLGMLFQQSSLAWRTGIQRADSFIQIRSLVGTFQRDASAAVSQKAISPKLRELFGDQQNFSGFPIKFYTLTGTGFEKDDPDGVPLRALSFISYDSSGVRTETTLKADGTKTQTRSTNIRKVFSTEKFVAKVENPEPVYLNGQSDPLPLYLRLKLSVQLSGKSYEIGAESAGPDGIFGDSASDPNGKDDIRTWVR